MLHENLARRNAPSNRSSERAFGFVFGAVFVVIGVWPLINGGSPRIWALVVALSMVSAGLWHPSLLARPNRLWLQLGALLHRIVSPVALAVMFFLVVTPTGLLMRLLGKDPLRLKRDPGAKSYWIARDPPDPREGGMRDQF